MVSECTVYSCGAFNSSLSCQLKQEGQALTQGTHLKLSEFESSSMSGVQLHVWSPAQSSNSMTSMTWSVACANSSLCSTSLGHFHSSHAHVQARLRRMECDPCLRAAKGSKGRPELSLWSSLYCVLNSSGSFDEPDGMHWSCVNFSSQNFSTY